MNKLLTRDDNAKIIQAFTPAPDKSQDTSTWEGTTVVFNKDGAGVDISNWLCIRVLPLTDSSYWYNTDTAKVYPLIAGQEYDIFVAHSSIRKVSVAFGTAATSPGVQGM